MQNENLLKPGANFLSRGKPNHRNNRDWTGEQPQPMVLCRYCTRCIFSNLRKNLFPRERIDVALVLKSFADGGRTYIKFG